MSDLRTVPLSVLDLAPIPEGGTAGDALRATIELARRAEQLGYHRFWVRSSNIIGSPETVRRGLTELLAATDADELMITTMVFDPADRLRSFELVAGIAAESRAGAAKNATAAPAGN